jgi:hypothetical protein
MRPRFVGMKVLIGRRDRPGTDGPTPSSLDAAIGVVQGLGSYIMLSAKSTRVSHRPPRILSREKGSRPILQTTEFARQRTLEGSQVRDIRITLARVLAGIPLWGLVVSQMFPRRDRKGAFGLPIV